MTFLIYSDEKLFKEADAVSMRLEYLGFNAIIDNSCGYHTSDSQSEPFDMIVSVGGDGTMLMATQKAISAGKPIFSINAGRVGFLSAFDFSDLNRIEKADILSLNLTERMLLEVTPDQEIQNKYLALNDVVVSRNGISKTVELKVYSDSQLIGEYRGDGVIISTPTGSTGYSLSAGGPIVDPLLDNIVVTPICAHTMFVRSIVLDGKKKVRVETSSRVDSDVYVALDSTHMIKLDEGFGITVQKSEKTLKLLSSKKRDYFEVLNKRIGSVY